MDNINNRKPKKSKQSSFDRKQDIYFNVLSQNVRGFQSPEKIEETINMMIERKIDIFLLQETHTNNKTENNDNITIHNYRIFLHGSNDDENSHRKGGVGIILSPLATTAWKNAGAIPPTLGKTSAGASRFMSINLLFQNESKEQKITFITAYHPHSGYPPDDINTFFQDYDQFIYDNCKPNHNIIIGCDANTCLGVAEHQFERNILGPHGLSSKRNDLLELETKELLAHHDLRSTSSDFKHHRYDTFTGHGFSSGIHQIDYVFVSNKFRKQIMNTKRTTKGIDSDHAAIITRIRFKKFKTKNIPKKATRKFFNWTNLRSNVVAKEFSKTVNELLLLDRNNNNIISSPLSLNDAILKAAEKSCPKPIRVRSDWFTNATSVLLPLIDARNKAFNLWSRKSNQPIFKNKLNDSRKHLRRALAKAKNDWVASLVKKLNDSEDRHDLKEAWSTINLINQNLFGHHKKPIDMIFNKPDGSLAETDAENLNEITNHFYNVFNNNNNDINIDEVLQDLGSPKIIQQQFSSPPSITELEEALQRTKNDKAPGPLGIPAEALKSLSDISLHTLHSTIVNIFNDPSKIPHDWHQVNLKCLHKKGSKNDPSNWRGICLKEPAAKLLSSILNQRLLKIFAIFGPESQYGCQPDKGCTDGLYVLRSLLQTRRQHNQESWILFIDIVKAFDSVNHNMLFELLLYYGVPTNIVEVIRSLYTGATVNIQLGQETSSIPYTMGVQQGDNMAPTLFLFAMLAFSDLLDKHWTTTWGLKPLTFNHFCNSRGRLLAQPTSSIGQQFIFPYLLYVDDSTFVFDSRNEIEKGTKHIFDTFKRIGFLMHVGTNNARSKSEAMFVRSSFINDSKNILPDQINISQGNVNFCNDFKYLGATISNDLTDNNEIIIRIKKANAQFGALKSVLLGPTLRLSTKVSLFNAIIINTVLWGCESWTLSTISKQRLLSFQHKLLRRILRISIYEVIEKKIKNSDVRKKFYNSPDIVTTIQARQLKWLSKISRMHPEKMPRKFLACWINDKRKPGRPQLNIRNTYTDAITSIIPSVSKNALLKEWIPFFAQKSWKQEIEKWILQKNEMNEETIGIQNVEIF